MEDRIYHTDGTSVESSLQQTFIYTGIEAGTNVKVKITKYYPSINIVHFAYYDKDGGFHVVAESNNVEGKEYYLTITPDIDQLLVSGCELVGIDTNIKRLLEKQAQYSDIFYRNIIDRKWVNESNVETSSSSFAIYEYDITDVMNLQIYAALGTASIVLLDNDGSVVSYIKGDDNFKSDWYYIANDNGATLLRISQLKNTYGDDIYNPKVIGNNITLNDSINYKLTSVNDAISRVDYYKNMKDVFYKNKLDGKFVDSNNEVKSASSFDLYEYNILDNVKKIWLYVAALAGYILVLNNNGEIVYKTTTNTDKSVWVEIDKPSDGVILRVSHLKQTETYQDAMPLRVLFDNQHITCNAKTIISKNMNYVGMSIWYADKSVKGDDGYIGYQSTFDKLYEFSSKKSYAYSGFSLGGLSVDDQSSIMASQADQWTESPNAIWTLDTITNDMGRQIPIGTVDDYENNTGVTTYYGALRLFRDKVVELSGNDAVVICANALYRQSRLEESIEEFPLYEAALCYVAEKNGWYFVDQYRQSINEVNAPYALYDGLHPNNFGYKLAVKPWVLQLNIISKILS